MFGAIYLNHFTLVEQSGFKCSNGIVYPIDWVLVPPKKLAEQLFKFPLVTSIFVNAIQATELQDTISEKSLTVFVPSNSAWDSMNIMDLVYLFSPAGRDDLKRVLQYHICEGVVYSTDLMEKVGDEIEVSTMLEGESISILVNKRNQQNKRKEGNSFKSKDRNDNKREGKSLKPNDFLIVLNNGAASVLRTDCIAENGTSHWINSVLIPRDVFENLPSRRLGQGGRQ